ncbi:hypothetical protein O181_063487 [Austropuccinia psidii MF-1]|uniref:Uncharacterized protein n=1 Tax=Austropuccinia psidii MF-1 TaxID=1389203 RepID=A0A9Q3EU26_9BASI|nr:hypothetical protein [Austropuccinia psidii MF-1]
MTRLGAITRLKLVRFPSAAAAYPIAPTSSPTDSLVMEIRNPRFRRRLSSRSNPQLRNQRVVYCSSNLFSALLAYPSLYLISPTPVRLFRVLLAFLNGVMLVFLVTDHTFITIISPHFMAPSRVGRRFFKLIGCCLIFTLIIRRH